MSATASAPPMVVLGFDWGSKSIGVAIGQSVTATANPLSILKARQGVPDWSVIQKLMDQWEPDLIVVGIPLNMDGTESESSLQARRFGRRLEGRFAIRWEGVDERLSTVEARNDLRDAGKSADRVDSHAAALIVESWFDQQN